MDNPKTFRFASTAPWHVEVGDEKRRVSKASARFFLEWCQERAKRVKVDDPAQKKAVLEHHTAAEKFWQDVLAKANDKEANYRRAEPLIREAAARRGADRLHDRVLPRRLRHRRQEHPAGRLPRPGRADPRRRRTTAGWPRWPAS